MRNKQVLQSSSHSSELELEKVPLGHEQDYSAAQEPLMAPEQLVQPPLHFWGVCLAPRAQHKLSGCYTSCVRTGNPKVFDPAAVMSSSW